VRTLFLLFGRLMRHALPLALAGAFCLGTAAGVQARQVDVLWSADAGVRDAAAEENMPASASAAREKAFEQAVWLEALSMADDGLSDARRELLREFIVPRAMEYVQSYSELGSASSDSGTTLSVDVLVNRRALKDTLRGLGCMRGSAEPVEYMLTIGGASDVWDELGRLQALYNTRVTQNASVAVFLEHRGDMWTGRLDAGGHSRAASGTTLADAWHGIWAQYFSSLAAAQGPHDALVLQVSGWFTPDGVESFDKELSSWDRDFDEAGLAQVSMEAAGISARWVLRGASRGALERRLEAALEGKGLSWVLEPDGSL
jgi:hypothetical protein